MVSVAFAPLPLTAARGIEWLPYDAIATEEGGSVTPGEPTEPGSGDEDSFG